MPSITLPKFPILICSSFTAVLAISVLTGWAFDIDVLKSIVPGLPMMKPNTAVAFLLIGITLFVLRNEDQRVGLSFAMVGGTLVFLLGILTVTEYMAGIDLPIDGLLIGSNDYVGGGAHVGRMSPHSAFNFTLVGMAIVLLGTGSSKIAEVLLTIVQFVTVVAALGLLYGTEKLYGATQYNAMAVHTALLFFVSTSGLLLTDLRSGLSRMMSGRGAGASIGRRIIPVVLTVPPAAGLVLHAGYTAGFYDASFRLALTIALSMIVMSIVLSFFSRKLDRLDKRRQRAEQDLADKEARYRELFDYSQGLICIHDLDGVLTTINRATLQMLEYPEEEIIGKNIRDLVRPDYRPHFDAYLRQVTHEGLSSGLLELISRTGKSLVLRYNNILATEDGKEPYILGHAQNVTELLEAQKQLKNLSLTDELTGLYNRRGFLTLAEQQVKLEMHNGTARGLTLLFADMDGLKAINDTHGHEAGSEAIATLARLIKSAVRDADVVARWGGDEFVVLTIGAKGESPKVVAERIGERMDEYNAESGLPYTVACSIGVAPIDHDDGRSLEEMIAAADEAMYAEKKRRKAMRGIDPIAQPTISAESQPLRN